MADFYSEQTVFVIKHKPSSRELYGSIWESNKRLQKFENTKICCECGSTGKFKKTLSDGFTLSQNVSAGQKAKVFSEEVFVTV